MTQDLIRQFIDTLPLPSVVLDHNGRIFGLNEAATILLGHGRIGMHYITAFRQPDLLDAVETCLGTATDQTAQYLARDNGRDVTWQVHLGHVRGTGDVVLTFEDISPLQDAEKMRRDFVANVSHELRTPLTSLLGFIETLRGAAKDDPNAREQFLSIMQDEAGRMTSLVEDLLSLSRVEETERMRPLDPVSLKSLICATCNALTPVAKAADVSLDCDLPDHDCTVPADEGQLRQVLTNLVGNAIKYGGDGGQVQITLTQSDYEPALQGPGVTMTVTDYGEGIAPHHLARLTERFYRVDTHRSREVGGTGLGLAIVKHIVNRHRGRLRIQSAPGERTDFIVVLPLT